MSISFYDHNSQPLWVEFKGFFIGLAIITVLIAGFIGFNIYQNATTPPRYVYEPDLQRDYNPTLGNKEARIKVMYFPDLQCEACRAQNPYLKEIKPKYKDRVQFIYKNNPGREGHPYADPAAFAANAVAKQNTDKFFQFVDKIYDNQDELSIQTLDKWAEETGVDMAQYRRDKNSPEIKNQVLDDQQDLINIELPASKIVAQVGAKPKGERSGTPTFIIFKDNQYYDWWVGVKTSEEFSKFLDEALK